MFFFKEYSTPADPSPDYSEQVYDGHSGYPLVNTHKAPPPGGWDKKPLCAPATQSYRMAPESSTAQLSPPTVSVHGFSVQASTCTCYTAAQTLQSALHPPPPVLGGLETVQAGAGPTWPCLAPCLNPQASAAVRPVTLMAVTSNVLLQRAVLAWPSAASPPPLP